MEIQLLFAVGIFSIIIFYIISRPRVGTKEPPLVPYTIPILGHTYDYLFNMENFAKKCKEQYGDCFSIYVFGSVMTIIARDSISEVFRKHKDFDMTSAASEFIPQNQIFTYNGGITKSNVEFHAKTTRDQVVANLEYNISVVRKYLAIGTDKWIGDCNHEPKIIFNAWTAINSIIALPIANIFVGEEAASHEDLVESFSDLAFDLGKVMLVPPILSFIHKKLHELLISLPLRLGWNPISRHRKIVVDRLRPVIEKRLKERKELGDNYKPYNDLLEYYMNRPNFDYTKPDNLLYHVDNLFAMVFAAIATTSRVAANALYDLASRPECMNELYEEASAVYKECNGTFTTSDIRKMKKLDSFIKESLRHTDDIISIPHYMISKSYTFSNGLTIPQGRMVLTYSDDVLKAKEAYGDDAKEFKPFRFVDTDSSATKVDRFFIIFGGGRHACPGRFFAINEAKLLLINLILRYNISTKSGKIANKLNIGPFTLPPRDALVFENRK